MNCLHIILAPAAGLIAGLTAPTLLAAAGQNAASPVNIQITVTERNSLAISLDIAEFNCEQVSADGERLTRISLDQEASTRQAGMPELPVVTRVVMLPPRGGVRVIIDDIETHIEKSVPIDADGDADGELGRGLREVGEDGFWPASPVVVGTPAILRGVRLAAVNCYPVQYNAITKQTRFIDRINFRLVFEGEGENEVENPDRLPLSSYAAKILDELVLNPPPQRDDVMSGVYLYIVPQFNGVDTTLAPLINWRMRQGHKVSVARVVNDAPSATILAVIRQAYEADPPVEFVTLVGDAGGIENSLRLPAATNTGDYQYTRLDGNDPLPDIALGRLSAHTLQELALIVNKIVSYESNPMMGNTNWFRQGLVVAGARINGKSEILTAKYARRNLLELGWREVRNWYWDERGDIGGNEQVNFLNDNFNWGISVLFYRAYQRMNGLSNDAITNLPNRDGRWPFVITISCDTGDFTGNSDGQSEAFLRARGGGIAAIGTATPMTNVMFNNIVAGGTFKGVYIMGLHNPGWGLNWGKYELWRAYDGLDPNYSGFMDWNNLMGDPGTRLWTGVPLEISVEHPQNLALGQTYFPVLVRDRQTNEPLAQAQVCLWKSGELHSVMKTDASGAARFFIEAEALTAGSLLVTVTKHNVRPYLGSATVARNDRFLGLTEWTIADNIRGNGNWTLNPNEDFDIQLNVRNSGGQRIDGRLAATLLSHSEWVEISADTLEIENAPEVGQSLRLEFNGRTSPLCPDLTEHNLELIIWNDNERWVSSASPVSAAPVLEVIGVNGVLVPGEVRDINIRLHNRGRQALPAFRVRLESQSDAVSVERGEVNFPALAVDGDAYGSQPFRLSTRPFVLPGQPARLSLTTEVNNVPLAAATTLHIGAPGDGDPFGPDEYGYYCFDSGDRGYEIAPVYRWIEIDPNIEPHDFEGMDMRIRDTGDNRDSSAVVQLPFDFQYYGQTFRQLTVCTNGWAAFGDQAELSDFRNTHIGQALGPVAQLCVWWDNLMTTNESRILTFHDRETGRFIVEWSRMRRLLTQGQGALETFQLILYDPAVRPTFTGDGIIDFQYRDVTNEDRTARNDVPYCTIGISNLDDSGGLEYTYWNRYTTGAMPIQPLMTIRWTTASQLISGVIKGAVRDLATGEPVEGAVVTVSRGYRTQTDRQGGYLLDVLVGENYFVTAGGIGWNDTTRTGFNVAENETLTVDLALRHPEIALSIEEVQARLNPGRTCDVQFELSNSGNGPLMWMTEKRIIGESPGGLGPRRRSFMTGQMTQDRNLQAVAYVNRMFFVTGSDRDPNPVYVLDSTGFMLRTFPQLGRAENGMTDLAWDGELLWGSGERNVYGWTLQGEERARFTGPYSNNIGLAWDDTRQVLWICGGRTPFRGYDREGNLCYSKSNFGFTVTSLDYWREDPDGCPLYFINCTEHNFFQLQKLNPDNDSIVFVAFLQPENGGQPCGAFITNEFGIWGWTLMVVMNNVNQPFDDRIDIYQMGVNSNWLRLDADWGRTEAGGRSNITLTLDAAALEPEVYAGEIVFNHNAASQRTILPVTLTVTNLDVLEAEIGLPAAFLIEPPAPNPFNSNATVRFILPDAGEVHYRIYDLAGRLVSSAYLGRLPGGNHRFSLNGAGLSSGLYWLYVQSGVEVRTVKFLCIK